MISKRPRQYLPSTKRDFSLNKLKVLITGISGFLGCALWRYFERSKFNVQVYGLDKAIKNDTRKLFGCDLAKKSKLRPILHSIKPDFIFHLAGGRMPNYKALFQSNYLTTKCLLETIMEIRHYSPRVVIPGSAVEYGPSRGSRRRMKETDIPAPETTYGRIKLKQTHLGLRFAKQGADVIIARIFNVMGEGTPSALAIGQFAKQIVMIEQGCKEKIIYTKNLEGKRDFLDVDDISAALWAVARYGQSGEIYNVCSGRPFEIRKALKKLLSFSRVKKTLVVENKNSGSSSFDVIGSNAKLRSISGWVPQVTLERSLINTLHWYQNQKNIN